MNKPYRPIVLIILDGWGHSDQSEFNAIAAADTPNWDRWWQTHPHTLISGSGKAVGLPEGQMGNSEVGHMHIGAGRIVRQDFTRIEDSIATGEFAENKAFINAINRAKLNNSGFHIMGLLSPGGVHSHEQHIIELVTLAAQHGLEKIYVHAFLDGRDTPPKSAGESIAALSATLKTLGKGQIASICGRYYAMDRDNRWDRIAACYQCLTAADTEFTAKDAYSALEQAYARGETDEFVQPTVIYDEQAITINDDDVVVFMNFRADRARQLSRAFTEKDFNEFTRQQRPQLAEFVTLTQYSADMKAIAAFPPQQLHNTLGEYLANQGLKQLRIAETEKYAHVTFFLNGGNEQPFANEERILVSSPAVATYDLCPEMSAPEVTDKIIAAIEAQQFDAIICNFANADMVGHSGNFDATKAAVHCLDTCLGKIHQALNSVNGEMLITADHGNAERMFDESTKQAHTAHTKHPVPLLYVGRNATVTMEQGSLTDVAPTFLYLLGLTQPTEMTGQPLLELDS